MTGLGSSVCFAVLAQASAPAPSSGAANVPAPAVDESPAEVPEAPFWDPTPNRLFTVGWLHTFRHGPTKYGNGLELTYTEYPFLSSEWPFGLGGYAQLQSVGREGQVALSVGPQLNLAIGGLELGYEYLSAGHGRSDTHGVHLAPFVSLGFVSLAWHALLPFASSGRGESPRFQHALAMTVKLPIPVHLDFPHGRPLRHSGQTHLAEVSRCGGWQPAEVPSLGGPQPALAELWLERALAEHASIATFAQLTLELLAHGAPARLLQAAQRAQADEIRHALACFGVAAALSNEALGAGDFPAAVLGARELSLSELAVESLRDGLLGEGYGAALAGAARARVAPELHSLFEAVAREEAEHAELGFDVLRWCLETGGTGVATAVAAALGELPDWVPAPMPGDLAALPLEAARHGVLPVVEQALLFLEVRERVEARVRALLDEASQLAERLSSSSSSASHSAVSASMRAESSRSSRSSSAISAFLVLT